MTDYRNSSQLQSVGTRPRFRLKRRSGRLKRRSGPTPGVHLASMGLGNGRASGGATGAVNICYAQFIIYLLVLTPSLLQVMCPSDHGDSSRPSAPAPIPDSEDQLSAVQDPFAPFEEARSNVSASDAHERVSRPSASSERLDRLERLLAGMARQFADQQLQVQAQVREVVQVQRGFATSSEFSAGESIFGDYMRRQDHDLDRRMRPASLEEPVDHWGGVQQVAHAQQQPPMQPTPHGTRPSGASGPAGLSGPTGPMPGKEIYPGVDPDFMSWGQKFLTRLWAAQAMSGGNWTEDFLVMAISGKLEGPALAFYDKMQLMLMAGSGTVTHMLDRMLGFYSTKTPVTKAMELMFEPKPADKTWTEYFQYLVYVAEKSGCPGAFVLQCVCDSATSDTKKTMLTNLDKDRPDAMRHAWELVAFAVEYDSVRGAGGRGGAARGGSGGRDGNGGQGGHSQGFVARVEIGDSRACWECGKLAT
ncbi:hypothetical protein PF001_g12116 [Phytophthora fragariae]|uniref:Uncharacterized protein n=2 Tax=Phytophthora fragariae TaxID=53985 RepID=A0A6A4DDE8_9STRA|nr:hypothetical protein PF001_g12116 [Phytophthora fragariae]